MNKLANDFALLIYDTLKQNKQYEQFDVDKVGIDTYQDIARDGSRVVYIDYDGTVFKLIVALAEA